ncbi:MAG: STAS domain-containing protein [Oscillospiraceae bacterium]|nr:STAS domain-containing protein [Oscillospiraceae bacterium]
MFNISKKKEGSRLTVRIGGDLDRTTAPELEADIMKCFEGITELVIDLEELDYISSAGLRTFVKFRKMMNKQGSMQMLNIKSSVREILDLSGLADFLIGADN